MAGSTRTYALPFGVAASGTLRGANKAGSGRKSSGKTNFAYSQVTEGQKQDRAATTSAAEISSASPQGLGRATRAAGGEPSQEAFSY